MRYVLRPGVMMSKNDGQDHFIGAAQLARLYGVKIEDCLVVREGDLGYFPQEGDVQLWPRYDGDYSLPKQGTSKEPACIPSEQVNNQPERMREMNTQFDSDVLAVLEFMQTRVPAGKLVGVAQAVNGLAGTLWGHHAPQGVTALQLVTPPIGG